MCGFYAMLNSMFPSVFKASEIVTDEMKAIKKEIIKDVSQIKGELEPLLACAEEEVVHVAKMAGDGMTTVANVGVEYTQNMTTTASNVNTQIATKLTDFQSTVDSTSSDIGKVVMEGVPAAVESTTAVVQENVVALSDLVQDTLSKVEVEIPDASCAVESVVNLGANTMETLTTHIGTSFSWATGPTIQKSTELKDEKKDESSELNEGTFDVQGKTEEMPCT